MSQTNRTPAGPDRGSIATGQQTPEQNGESAAGNGRVVDTGAEGSAPAAGRRGRRRPRARRSPARTSSPPRHPPRRRDEPREPDATATAKFRVPASAQSRPAGDGGKDTAPAADSPLRRLRRWTRCPRRRTGTGPGRRPAAAVAPDAGTRDPGGAGRVRCGRSARRRPHGLPRGPAVRPAGAVQGRRGGRRRDGRLGPRHHPLAPAAAGRAAAAAARPVVGAQARPGAGRRAVLHLAGRGRGALRGARRHGRLGPAQRHVRGPGLRRGPDRAAR